MRTCSLTAVGLAGILFMASTTLAQKDTVKETKKEVLPPAGVCHLVYFTLNDNSPEAQKKLVDACSKYLSRHKGILSFSAGVRATDLKGGIYDTGYDVSLSIVFADKPSHDAYQDAADHKTFIEENKANWKKVRVFDFAYTGGKQPAAAEGKEPRIAHAVFFTLVDKSPEGQAKFVEAVNSLNQPPQASYRFFATGARIPSLDRDVNDKDFDVGLFIIFADRKGLDEYGPAAHHLKFVETNKTKWKGVRVFDSTLMK
jgi:hypothetical protein